MFDQTENKEIKTANKIDQASLGHAQRSGLKLVQKTKAVPVMIKANNKKKSAFLGFAENFNRLYRLIFLLFFVVLFLALGAGSYYFYKINVEAVESLIKNQQEVLRQRQKELSELKSIKVSYEDLEDSSKRILEILPDQKDLPSIFVQLEALAHSHNLFLGTIDIAGDTAFEDEEQNLNSSKLHKLNINLSLTGGDYFTLKEFLLDVEKNLRLLDIKSIVFTPESNTYNLIINTYYFGEVYEPETEEN